MPKKKKNFIRKSNYNFKKSDGFTTVFHLNISSKAMFNLSDGAFKLYNMFLLNGRKNTPTIRTFAQRLKRSERTVSRYYDELKEKGFLELVCVSPKVYEYKFDLNGNLGHSIKEETKVENEKILVEKQIEEEERLDQEVLEEKVVTPMEEEEKLIIKKTKTILEYEDFAVLENMYWSLDNKVKDKVKKILNDRKEKEPNSKEVIEWFLEKIKLA